MFEKIKVADLLDKLAIPVYSTNDVDKRLGHDRQFRNNIAGFTSTGFGQFLNGLTTRHAVIKAHNYARSYHYPHINCDLAPAVYEEIFNIKPRDQSPITKTILVNREYGKYWSATELLLEYRQIYKTRYGKVGNVDHDLEELEKHLFYPGYINSDPKEIFLSRQAGEKFADELNLRKGVQILFTTNGFTPFIKEKEYEPTDDYGITVYADISIKLVCGVIPLGRYESEVLRR